MVFNGRVLDVIEVNEKITHLVVQNKKDGMFFPVCFVGYDSVKKEIKKLSVEKKDVVKIQYYIKSKKWQNKYYTSVMIESIKITKKRPLEFSFDSDTGEIY